MLPADPVVGNVRQEMRQPSVEGAVVDAALISPSIAKEVTIQTLDAVNVGAEVVQDAALLTAAGATIAGQPEIAIPALGVAAAADVTGVFSASAKAIVTSDQKDISSALYDAAFMGGTRFIEGRLKRIPGGQFAGKLTQEELATLMTLIEGSGQLLKKATKQHVVNHEK